MKTSRDVYKKLRDVKHHYLVKLYKKYSRKIPENCKYNHPYPISYEGNKTVYIRLCLLHQPSLHLNSKITPHLIEVCQEIRHCSNCNGFIPKFTKEEIKEILEKDLKDKNKRTQYPDFCALEWVLEQTEEPPFNSFIRVIKNFFIYRNQIRGKE